MTSFISYLQDTVFKGRFRKNEGLNKGITGQPVCTVQTGTGYLTDCIEVGYGGPAMGICKKATTHIVSSRYNGDWLSSDVYV